jgi:hypothetical protein
MVIDDFDAAGISVAPLETDAILIVDPNAALSFPATRKRFEP